MTASSEQGYRSWEDVEAEIDKRHYLHDGTVATMQTPISINGLKRNLKALKERHGSKVQIVPHEWGLEFVVHGVGVVPK